MLVQKVMGGILPLKNQEVLVALNKESKQNQIEIALTDLDYE